MSDIIWGEQRPLYCAPQDPAVVATWKDFGIGDLLALVGPKKFLRLMVSPTGIFGFYDGNLTVDVRDNRIWVTPAGSAEEFEVPHIRFEADAASMMHQWSTKGPSDFFLSPEEHCYFRTIGGVLDIPRIMHSLPDSIPRDRHSLREVNLYLSQTDTVTNLHYDPVSGAICQLKGSKRALLFPPSERDKLDMYPPEHFLGRRSRHPHRLTQAAVDAHPTFKGARGVEYIIQPGQWLYLPKGWLHTIETLEDNTVSLIVTFCA